MNKEASSFSFPIRKQEFEDKTTGENLKFKLKILRTSTYIPFAQTSCLNPDFSQFFLHQIDCFLMIQNMLVPVVIELV